MKTSKPKTLEIIYHDLRPSKKKILGKGFDNICMIFRYSAIPHLSNSIS